MTTPLRRAIFLIALSVAILYHPAYFPWYVREDGMLTQNSASVSGGYYPQVKNTPRTGVYILNGNWDTFFRPGLTLLALIGLAAWAVRKPEVW